MSVARSEIEKFFADYASALGARDVARIASHWGVPALVLSDQGALAVSDIKEVETFFESSMEQYAGIAAAHATIASTQPLSDAVVGCAIGWKHEDAEGKEIGGEAGYYTLKKDGRVLKIHAYTPGTA